MYKIAAFFKKKSQCPQNVFYGLFFSSPGSHIARYYSGSALWELGSAGAMFARILLPGWFQVRISQMKECAWDLESRNKAANMILWRSLWLDVVTVGNRSVNDLKLVLALLSLVSRNASQLLTLLTNSGPGPISRHLLVGPQRWQFHELSHHTPMSARYAWLPILVTPFLILWLLSWPFTSPAPSKTV